MIAHIAYDMMRTNQTAIACDDPLYEPMASDLEAIYRLYHRRRRVMPNYAIETPSRAVKRTRLGLQGAELRIQRY